MTRALSDSMVKACLFLLSAVAVADDATCAASSPGCPSKMQADANTLLQTGVRIGDELARGRTLEEEGKNTYTDEATNPHKVSWMQEGMNTQQLKEKLIDNSKGKGRRDVLIQLSRFVNTLGNATKHFNSSNADNLKEVIKILRAVMYKSMNTDHTEDQTELNQAFAGITTCNTDRGKAITDNVTPLKNTMVTARSTHTTCRSEEGDLETIKDGKWNEMNTHIVGISTPPSVTTWPVPPTYDTLVPYFSTGYAEWFVRHKQAFDTKNNAYVTALTNWTTGKDRCDSDQTSFESDFCVYSAVLDTTCLNHNTCHTIASSGATTTTARVKVTEAARKDAYKAGEEIVCRINALLANRAYSECDDLTVDTSNYSIVYATADAKDSCVTEVETPCSNTWKDTEYNGLPSNAPNTACTPCQAPSVAPTVAPTTAPPSATSLVSPGVYITEYAGGRGSLLPPGGPSYGRLTINCDSTIGYDHCYGDACVITTSLTNWCVNAGSTYAFAPTVIFNNMHENPTRGGTNYDCMQVNSDGSLQGFHYYEGFWGAATYAKESPLVCD